MTEEKLQRPGADQTRAKILKAAKALFVKKGFAAASMSQIAKNAGLNQSLIYHHFENKETLWRLVKADIIKSDAQAFSKFFEKKNLSGREMIRCFLRLRIELAVKKPEIQKMILWQHIESNHTRLRYIPGYEIEQWLAHIKNLQEGNELRRDLPPRIISALISAQANGLLSYMGDLTDLDMWATCVDSAEEMLCNFLLTTPSASLD